MTRRAPLPSLAPDERVLWQGPARIGAVWPPFTQVLKKTLRALGVAVVVSASLVLAALIERFNGRGAALVSFGWLGLFALALAASVLLVIEASRRLGPYHFSYVLLVLVAPPATFVWISRELDRGWSGAVASVRPIDFALAALVALPLARIAVGIALRSTTTYVITDRRVAALRRGRTVWERPAADLRVETCWWGDRLVVGLGRDLRELHVRPAPAAVLDEVRARRCSS